MACPGEVRRGGARVVGYVGGRFGPDRVALVSRGAVDWPGAAGGD